MKNKSLTLIELLISISIMSIIIVGIYSVIVFSSNQIVSTNRKLKVQTGLALALEHITKYIQQANGNFNEPAIELFPSGSPTGFRVRVDFNSPSTPSNLDDDAWIRYRLNGNVLEATCTGGGGSCPAYFPVDLSSKILAGFDGSTVLPSPLPNNPTAGFYVRIEDIDGDLVNEGSIVNIGLIGRYTPTEAVSPSNPQVEMKTKIICNSASVN